MYDYKTFNTRVKVYPDGSKNITMFNQSVFNPDKVDTIQSEMMSKLMKELWSIKKQLDFYELNTERRNDNVKKSKEKIFDIAILNVDKWTHMFTLTINPEKADRFDYIGTGKKICNFWVNMKKRYRVEYLFIPELHKDGAIHFHGLMSVGDMPLVDSGKKDESGRSIFNIKTYHYGFTTAVPIDKGTSEHVCKYITKYITKDMIKITPRSFYYSQGLNTEVETNYYNCDFKQELDFVQSLDIVGEWLQVKYLRTFSF